MAEKKIVEVEEGQLENLSEVITIPDFSEKKEVLQEEKIYGNNSESKSDRREEIWEVADLYIGNIKHSTLTNINHFC